MAIPDYQSLMLPVLEIACTGESSVPETEAAITTRFGLTPEESEQRLPSGKQRVLPNRIHWAKFYLTKAGFLETPRRGRFAITDSGRHLLAHPPETLNTKYLMSTPAFRDFWFSSRNGEEADGAVPVLPVESDRATPEETVEAAYKAMQAALRSTILGYILQKSPGLFERLIVELLVAMGYGGSQQNAAEQLGRTGDGGVDGVIN